MPYRRCWRLAERLLAALFVWGALTGMAAAEEPSATPLDERLVLAVAVDGVAAPEPVLVRRQGAALWMRTADLRALGIAVRSDALDIALASIPGLRVVVDDGAQTIALTRTGEVQRVRLAEPSATGSAMPVTPNDWGAVVNYDLSATRAARSTVAAGLIDAIMYAPHGYLFGGAVVSVAGGRAGRRFTRLETGYTLDDPASARRLTLGDLVTGATEQSRPVRIAGVQVATDFDLRPDLVTFPVPALAGTAAAPSAVDLIVNGSRRSAGEVRAGQFAVTDVPLQAGANTVTVAVRDVLGRETRQTLSTYVSRALLRPGLFAYSAEAGWVRTGYATARDRYADPVASGSLRVGLGQRFTAEAHGEAGARVGLLTAGGALGLGNAGLVSGSVGVSAGPTSARRAGTQLAVGYERVGGPVSIAAHYTRNCGSWYDLAADHGSSTRAHLLALSLGFDLRAAGHWGATLIEQGRGRVPRPAGYGPFLPDQRLPSTTVAAFTYSVRAFGRVNLVANAGADIRARRSGYLSVAALLVFGRRSSGYGGLLARAGGTSATAEYSRVATDAGEVGYRFAVAQGAVDRLAADISYQSRAGFYGAQIERTNKANAARLSARGALIVGRDGVLTADRVVGSFAVVDTRGQAGVPVFRDNRQIGVTDRRGKLVLTNLKAYEAARISLDPVLVDAAMLVDRTEQVIRPAAKAGVPVRFALRASATALITLVDAAGAPIAAGSRSVVNGGRELPVGLGGDLYAEDLHANNIASVHVRGSGICIARFGGLPAGAPLRRLGPVACLPARIAAN